MFHKTCTNRSSLLASSILLQRSLAKEERRRRRKKAFKNSFNTCQSKLYSINSRDEPWSDPCSSPGSVDNYTARMSCERKKKNKQKERKKASKQASFRNSFDDTWLRRYNSVSQNLHLEPSSLSPSLHCFFLFVSLCLSIWNVVIEDYKFGSAQLLY